MTKRLFFRSVVTKVLLVAFAAAGTFLIPSREMQAQSYDVCPSNCPYQSIQPALNAADPGSTVTVGPGTYNESITLQAGVSLSGAGAAETILQGSGTHPVITASGSGIQRSVTVQNLAVTGGAGAYGAGILVQLGAAPTIRNVSIYGNSATLSGGGVAVIRGGDVLMENVEVHDNAAHGGVEHGGAGVYASEGRVSLLDCIFDNNHISAQANGGALLVRSSSQLTMENSTVRGSTAVDGGGLKLKGTSTATISGGRFENNVATGTGGAISVGSNSTLTIDDALVANNRANMAGGIAVHDGSFTALNSRFELNRSRTMGGALMATGGATLIVENSQFVENVAEHDYGGAINSSESEGEVRNSTFEGNQAADGGGAINFVDMTNNALLAGNILTNNQAGSGGAISVEGGLARIMRNKVRDNHAESFGGGIVVIAMSDVLIQDNEIEHNSAGVDGGGLVLQNGATGVVEGNVISFNQAGELAGGVKIFNRTSPTVRNNRVEGNVAGRAGGGIHFEEQSHPLVENNDFVGNVAGTYGGAAVAHLSSNPVLRANTFIRNRAEIGGGAVYIHVGCHAQIEHNTLSDNWSRGVGGALLVEDDNASQVTANYFSRNQSEDRGGAIFIRDSSVQLSGNQIMANTTTGLGGGVAAVNAGNPQILNNLIAGNHAGGDGDGVYLRANVTFRNNTVAHNDRNRNGDGIFLSGASGFSLSNNLVFGNDSGIRSLGAQPSQLTRNCFFDNRLANYDGVPPGLDDLNVDPILISGPLGSYYLAQATSGQSSTSPLVDALSQTAQALGLEGQTTRTDGRPDQGLADLGFHYRRPSAPKQFLPMLALSN